MTKIKINPLSKIIAKKTEDAYSADAFGPGEWIKAIQMLFDRGYNAGEVEAIMRSKWTRWSRDAAGSYEGKAKDLIAFMDDPRNKCGRAQVAELVEQTNFCGEA